MFHFHQMIVLQLSFSLPPLLGILLEWEYFLLYVSAYTIELFESCRSAMLIYDTSLNITPYPEAVNMSHKGDGDVQIVTFQSYNWHLL